MHARLWLLRCLKLLLWAGFLSAAHLNYSQIAVVNIGYHNALYKQMNLVKHLAILCKK